MSNSTYKKERRFGLLLGGFILSLCLYKLMRTGSLNYYLIGCGLCLLLPALVRPRWLVYPRICWEKLAHGLGTVNTMIWLILIYILIFIPLGLLFKLIRRDALAIMKPGDQPSYWQPAVKREPSSLTHQF
ncbi:SxtJ family membrane protein [Mucilaginibacter gynuensis]|uniref:SxtJ family membrane protein n=1 Tax=Mucilaginibacter gynuensis TaxID=1302236 RepID=UPI0031E7290F